jgi:hypothetical protein
MLVHNIHFICAWNKVRVIEEGSANRTCAKNYKMADIYDINKRYLETKDNEMI